MLVTNHLLTFVLKHYCLFFPQSFSVSFTNLSCWHHHEGHHYGNQKHASYSGLSCKFHDLGHDLTYAALGSLFLFAFKVPINLTFMQP